MIPGKLLKKASDQGLLREMIGFVAQSLMGLEMASLIHTWRTDLELFSRRCFWLSVPVNHRGTARSSMFNIAVSEVIKGSQE
jgi:hypothetical protein